ncbi:glycosyltransferase [Ralstonia pseudosolanacearum]|uniref:glycosyltransferase family 2 protein n=1 Tax=Ralstonia pseudosolanacearum TaxID=1310165 RepID=UPI0006BE1156|nr:glycosyltransferase family 2 protein [Ralstonia pseudosolanacearum]AKZ28413.1 family 2 glycosyl transferase [Ralstonia solanacearum]
MRRQPKPGRRPDLALVVIARNEAACIERCLRSARPHVDRMIVLDTGSTDATVAIAEACGAQVRHFTWVDDFSAARNAALQFADADWNLVMDADEWLERGAGELREACTFGPLLGVVCIQSLDDAGGATQRTNTWIPRLLPRGVRYQGRVHEQPVASLRRVRLPLVFGHDGYVSAKLEKKRGRNAALLHAELADRPDDPYVLYQLGKETEINGKDPAQAADLYAQATAGAPANAPYRHDACIRLLLCLRQSGRLDEAITRAGEWMDTWAVSPDYFFVLGHLMFDAALRHPAQAAEHWLPMAEHAFLRCLAIGDQPKLDDSVFGRGSFAAAENLAVVYRALNQPLKADEYQALSQRLRADPAAR